MAVSELRNFCLAMVTQCGKKIPWTLRPCGFKSHSRYYMKIYNSYYNNYKKMYKGKLVKRSSQNQRKRRIDKDVLKLQKKLYDAGAFGNIPEYKAVDGIMGPMTRRAFAQFIQNKTKLPFQDKKQNKQKLLSSIQNINFFHRYTNNNSAAKDVKQMSLEEYKESKREEIRQKAARVNSQTITPDFPILAGGPQKGHDLDVYGKKKWSEDRVKTEFKYYITVAENYLRNNPDIEPLAKQRIQDTISYYKKVVADPHYIDRYGGGFGCIYTASGAYGNKFRYASNSDLANKTIAGKDTGFEIVDVVHNPFDWKIGDIVQVGRSEEGNSPHHAEMVVSKRAGFPVMAQTNAEGYSPSDKENNVALYRLRERMESGGGGQVLRFVGTKAQNKQWEQEYYAMQRKGNKK